VLGQLRQLNCSPSVHFISQFNHRTRLVFMGVAGFTLGILLDQVVLQSSVEDDMELD
jgi:hypothetical protein